MGTVLSNRGDGTLASPIRARVDIGQAEFGEVAIADFDADGQLDVVAGAEDGTGPFFLFGAASDGFAAGQFFRSEDPGARGLAVAEFNGDGLPDLVISGRFRQVAVLINRGDRTFEVREDDFELVSSELAIAAEDLDGDGAEDVVFEDRGTLVIGFGDGSGGFPRLVEIFRGVIDSTNLELLDVDRDGSLDLIVLDQSGFRVLYNDGTGALDESVTIAAEIDDHARLDMADVNADGLTDVVVERRGLLSIFRGTVEGSLELIDEIMIDPRPRPLVGVALGDVDGDGAVDILVSQDSNSTSVLLNRGDGSFRTPIVVLEDEHVRAAVEVADMNGDGLSDIISLDTVIAGIFGEVTILLNRCRPAECPADLDRDGRLTLFDFLEFQNAFDAGDLIADFDGDGELTLFDFLEFQNQFDQGCA